MIFDLTLTLTDRSFSSFLCSTESTLTVSDHLLLKMSHFPKHCAHTRKSLWQLPRYLLIVPYFNSNVLQRLADAVQFSFKGSLKLGVLWVLIWKLGCREKPGIDTSIRETYVNIIIFDRFVVVSRQTCTSSEPLKTLMCLVIHSVKLLLSPTAREYFKESLQPQRNEKFLTSSKNFLSP